MPVLPAGLTYVEVGAGSYFSVARRSDGSVVAWGLNGYGQINVPPLPPGTTCVALDADIEHTLLLLSNGSVLAFGGSIGHPRLSIYNGLNLPVHVEVQGQKLVLAGGEHREATFERGAIEVMALERPARGAGWPAGRSGDRRDAEAVLRFVERDHGQAEPAALREGACLRLGRVRVRADAESEVEPLGVVAELDQGVPEGEAVFPAGDRDEDALVLLEHVLALDRPLHAALEEEDEARLAEGGVVTPQLDDRLLPAALALHAIPPEITARSSISSVSATNSSSVNSSSPRMTMTVPARIPSDWSKSPTRRRPAMVNCFPWGSRRTCIGGCAS